MFRAFTLIEILITLTILVISLYFISPAVFYVHDRIALNDEIENVRSFIYQIQTLSRYKKQNYSLTVSQDEHREKWCIVAVKKERGNKGQLICDCLNLQSCQGDNEKISYFNMHKKIKIRNKSLYPNSFINIDGLSGRLEAKCIHFEINGESEILQLEQTGRVYVMPKNKRSQCKD